MRAAQLSIAIAALSLAAAPAAPAAEGQFPDKPIRLIIGSAPGSGPDIMARLIADHLYGGWGQRVVVDSRPGVAGIISAENALRANPDGYTWMMLTSQLFIATSVYPNLKFDLDSDFVSMSLVGFSRDWMQSRKLFQCFTFISAIPGSFSSVSGSSFDPRLGTTQQPERFTMSVPSVPWMDVPAPWPNIGRGFAVRLS